MRFLLTEIYTSNGTLNPQFMRSCFKSREVPYNMRRGAFHSTWKVYWSLIWNELPNLVNLTSHDLNLRILSIKSKILTVGVWYVEGSTFWVNFHVSLVLLCVLSDHVDTSHLTLYCSQLTGCCVTCKTAENVEHLGYWLRVCHLLCHFVCHFFFTLY